MVRRIERVRERAWLGKAHTYIIFHRIYDRASPEALFILITVVLIV